MIKLSGYNVGFHVFYQPRPDASPEYGVITGPCTLEGCVFVRFNGDVNSKATPLASLYWPPDYCAKDGGCPPGQPYSSVEELIEAGLRGVG